jgi:hypothetical protein
MPQFLGKESGHDSKGFLRFGKLEVVPEGVRKGLKDDELSVVAGAE